MKIGINLAVFSFHACPLASREGKETGGLNVYVLETAKELGRLGINVDMFTRSQNVKEPHTIQISKNVRLIHLVAGPEKYIPKEFLGSYIKSFSKAFFDFSKQDGVSYDLLHCHYYLSGLAGLIVKERINIPMVTSFHTLAIMKSLVGRTPDEKGNALRLEAEFRLVKESAVIVATSKNDAEYIRFLYDSPEEKIKVVNPGVDMKLFYKIPKKRARKTVGAPAAKKIILAVGRIEPLKGFDALMYSLKILLVKCPTLKDSLSLWIVGGDTSEPAKLWSGELKHLEKLKKSLGIEASVKLIGQKPQNELRNYYSAAEVVVMPSHYESFGMVALEAMACGTPVIITDVSGVSDLVGAHKAGLITSVNNPLLLAEQIAGFLFTDCGPEKYRLEAKTGSISRSWAKSSLELKRIYLDLVL